MVILLPAGDDVAKLDPIVNRKLTPPKITIFSPFNSFFFFSKPKFKEINLKLSFCNLKRRMWASGRRRAQKKKGWTRKVTNFLSAPKCCECPSVIYKGGKKMAGFGWKCRKKSATCPLIENLPMVIYWKGKKIKSDRIQLREKRQTQQMILFKYVIHTHTHTHSDAICKNSTFFLLKNVSLAIRDWH